MKINKQKLLQTIVRVLPVVFLVVSFFIIFAAKAHAADNCTPATGKWFAPIYKVLAPDGNGNFCGMGNVVANIWNILINVANSLVLAVLIYIAFMNILRIQMDSYAVKKFLPTFIMTIILANFSFLIARLVIDLGNIVISIFLIGDPNNQITGAFNGMIKDPPPTLDATSLPNYYGLIFPYLAKQILVGVGGVLVFILAFIFLIRNYMIYFLVAIAPLGFMAMMLPMTKKYFQMWWSNFSKWVFMPVISVFWLWLAGKFFESINPGGIWFLPLAFVGLCFYMAITSPFKVGGAAVSAWGNWGKKAWGKTGGVATKWAGGAIKERASDAGLRARLAVARTRPYQRVLGEDSGIGRYVSRAKSAGAERRLRLESPALIREKLNKDNRVNAAARLIVDPRTNTAARGRYVSLARSWVNDEQPSVQDFRPVDAANELRGFADPDNPTQLLTPVQLTRMGRRYTADNGGGRLMTLLTKARKEARNARDPEERRQWNYMLNGTIPPPATPGGPVWAPPPGLVQIPNVPFPGGRTPLTVDPAGFPNDPATGRPTSAVPRSTAPPPSTPPTWQDRLRQANQATGATSGAAPSTAVPTVGDFAAAVDKFTEAVEKMQGTSAGGVGNLNQDAMAAKLSEAIGKMKPTGGGVGVATVPGLTLENLGPNARAQLQTALDNGGKRAELSEKRLRTADTDSVIQNLKNVADHGNPTIIHDLADQGTQEVAGNDTQILNIGETNISNDPKANEITQAFEAVGGGVKQNALDKVQEYNQRIRAVQAGKPLMPGDTLKDLGRSFKIFTTEDWTEDFDIEDYKKRISYG